MSLALTASLFAGVGVTSTTANAAGWHKGMPKALQGTWKTKYSKAFGTSFKLKIGKNYAHAQGLDPDYLNNTHYRYLGSHKYKVTGYEPFTPRKLKLTTTSGYQNITLLLVGLAIIGKPLRT
ncbi:hypothetical protein [Secundilactobacillus silagei]|uniref:hypothetical protein n=1 Tax=Secundilactobacillus silagei TaxID=1293415 RepID=UPI002093DAC6|nr:hypothetical protein [Secundilactobacillus silagei]